MEYGRNGWKENEDGQDCQKRHLETDVKKIEWGYEKHNDVGNGKVVDRQGILLCEDGKTIDANHRGGTHGTRRHPYQNHITPDGDGRETYRQDGFLSAAKQQDEQLEDDADMQSAHSQDVAGTYDAIGILGILVECRLVAQSHRGDDGIVLVGDLHLSHLRLYLISPFIGLEQGAVEC